MPSYYNGIPANLPLPTQKTITDATNATPIVVQTGASHLLTTGDLVDVASVAGNTAANGTWPIQVVDATHAILVGSVGNGAYTSGGTLQSLGMGPIYPLPSDGDTLDAASVGVALEALGDRTAVLGADLGASKLLTFWQDQFSDPTENATWTSLFTLSLQNTWESLGGLASPPTGILQAGDVIEADLSATWVWADAGNSGVGMLIGLGIGYSTAGNLPASGTIIVGSGEVLSYPASNGMRTSQRIRGRAVVPANVQTAELYLMSFTRSASPANFTVQGYGSFAMLGSIWRPTGKPQ